MNQKLSRSIWKANFRLHKNILEKISKSYIGYWIFLFFVWMKQIEKASIQICSVDNVLLRTESFQIMPEVAI